MTAPNPEVDFYFSKAKNWKNEVEQLRKIVLSCKLTEELKWGVPCYTFQGGNVVLIHVFKEYCALLFFKGALLKDKEGMLVQQTKNVQAARQIRFKHVDEITDNTTLLKDYIREAMEIERSGLKVPLKKTQEFAMPDEFKQKLQDTPALKTAFEALTPGRQRAYLLHFSSAKQPKTREARIEKSMPLILEGKGLDD
ncbi:MAG TPA: DUF1801 domain-containing protein [Flavipsychrobacter sp.]|nr:DUF1801 domain-containing protein [Flavipsychrobacter sp.]